MPRDNQLLHLTHIMKHTILKADVDANTQHPRGVAKGAKSSRILYLSKGTVILDIFYSRTTKDQKKTNKKTKHALMEVQSTSVQMFYDKTLQNYYY